MALSRSVVVLLCLPWFSFSQSFAGNLLVADSGLPDPGMFTEGCHGYGRSCWDGTTSLLDAATNNSVTVTSTLEDFALLLAHDALWIDQRGSDLSTDSRLLSAAEADNVKAFIGLGRRVVMIGENASWNSWNQQILEIAGGTYSGLATNDIIGENINSSAPAWDDGDQLTSPVRDHFLTQGVKRLPVGTVGVADPGGTELLDIDYVTLWKDDNVLTVLDVSIFAHTHSSSVIQVDQFRRNVANWIVIPEPEGCITLIALLAWPGLRRPSRRERSTSTIGTLR